jgi:hypothetical protein
MPFPRDGSSPRKRVAPTTYDCQHVTGDEPPPGDGRTRNSEAPWCSTRRLRTIPIDTSAPRALPGFAEHGDDRRRGARLPASVDLEPVSFVERHVPRVRGIEISGKVMAVHHLQAWPHQIRSQAPSLHSGVDSEPGQIPQRVGRMRLIHLAEQRLGYIQRKIGSAAKARVSVATACRRSCVPTMAKPEPMSPPWPDRYAQPRGIRASYRTYCRTATHVLHRTGGQIGRYWASGGI